MGEPAKKIIAIRKPGRPAGSKTGESKSDWEWISPEMWKRVKKGKVKYKTRFYIGKKPVQFTDADRTICEQERHRWKRMIKDIGPAKTLVKYYNQKERVQQEKIADYDMKLDEAFELYKKLALSDKKKPRAESTMHMKRLCLNAIMKGTGWEKLSHVSVKSWNDYAEKELRSLGNNIPKKIKRMNTLNNYLSTIKGMVNYLIRKKKISFDLGAIPKSASRIPYCFG